MTEIKTGSKKSKKKIIAIDIDDCLVPYVDLLCVYFNKKWKTKKMKEKKPEDFYSYHFSGPLEITDEESTDLVEKFQSSEFFMTQSPIDGAVDAIKTLAKKYELIVVTSRQYNIEKQTHALINKFFPNIFTSINLCNAYGLTGEKKTKFSFMKKYGASLIVDDSPKYCNGVVKNKTGHAILFGDYAWNKDAKLEKGVVKAKNWKEVLQHIENLLEK